jgi:TolA-binding protein
MDLEGVKLDVVINQSKLSNSISINQKDTSQNTEAINQLRDQLSNMESRIVALEAKLDNPLPKKLTTNENSPENNESKTASPPTQPPLNQLHNVEISIIKPLALGLDENTNQSRVNLQSNQDQNEWLNPALDPPELNKTTKFPTETNVKLRKRLTVNTMIKMKLFEMPIALLSKVSYAELNLNLTPNTKAIKHHRIQLIV